MGVLNAERAQNAGEIIMEGDRPGWRIGAAPPAMVIANHPIVSRERFDLIVPLPAIGNARVQQHQRGARSTHLIIHVRAIDIDDARLDWR